MDSVFKGMGHEGIQALWKECKNAFVAKEDGKALSEKNFTAEYEEKLKGLTKDYNKLENIPSIEGFELTGNVTLEDIGIPFLLQSMLDEYTPRVNTGDSVAFDPATFAEGTKAECFTVNHMTTVRLTVVIKQTPDPAIENLVPVRVLTENLPPAHDENWKHLGRLSTEENVIIEFSVDQNGVLYMTSLGQIPSDRTYNIVFNYISA